MLYRDKKKSRINQLVCYSQGCHLSRTHAKTRARVLSSNFWTPSRYLLFFRGGKITQFARTRVHNILHSLNARVSKSRRVGFYNFKKVTKFVFNICVYFQN